MRTLAITQNITLDGSIEFLDDWFDPQARGLGDMSDLQEEVQRQSAASDAFLTGRQTFEDLRSYWPHREDDTTGTSAYLDAVAKYVVSSTLTEPGWENTHRSSPATRSRRSRALKAAARSRHRAHRQHHARPRPARRPAWSTRSGCSPTRSCRAAAGGCSRTGSSSIGFGCSARRSFRVGDRADDVRRSTEVSRARAGSTSTRRCGSLRAERWACSCWRAADRAGPEARGTRTT